jgi:SanA protein
MHRYLVERGVPDEVIYLDHAGLRTLDTMQRAARVFAVRDALVCSQRVFLPRALFLARHAGLDAIGVAADRRPYGNALLRETRELLATAAAVADTYLLGREPRFLGPRLPMVGAATGPSGSPDRSVVPARATHDRFTLRQRGAAGSPRSPHPSGRTSRSASPPR